MLRTLLLVLSFVVIWGGAASIAVAQDGTNSAPVSISSAIRQDPLLADVNRVNPADLAELVKRLNALVAGPRPPRTRTESAPATADELRQIARNPLFAAAYQHEPTMTLQTFRETIRLLYPETP